MARERTQFTTAHARFLSPGLSNRRELVISCARASGYVATFDLQLLERRSIILTRATLRSGSHVSSAEFGEPMRTSNEAETAGAGILVRLTRFAPNSGIGHRSPVDRARRRIKALADCLLR
jgi:hypothetical protein